MSRIARCWYSVANLKWQLKVEELVMAKAEKFQEAVVKLWLAEIKKLNISKEKICQIKDTTNKSLDL